MAGRGRLIGLRDGGDEDAAPLPAALIPISYRSAAMSNEVTNDKSATSDPCATF